MIRPLAALLLLASLAPAAGPWPEARREARPWTYWWWMGGAVDRPNLTRELERYRAAGLGGVHIIHIYGAKGYESRFVNYLSPQWLDMMSHAVSEAARLDMGVDMSLGSGWCFGGPTVKGDDACAVVNAETPGQISTAPCRTAVKRPGPGGAGPMLNPFQPGAITHYTQWFDQALAAHPGPRPRAVYHDSFEYPANWSAALPAEFARRRGYKLEDHWNALFANQSPGAAFSSDEAARVKSDYRETLSDLLLEEFTQPWAAWAKKNNFLTRDQAHGSPANLLDLYAAADIPETEMFNKDRNTMVSKLASSAAHTAGHNLTASESGTWLREHFTETLGDLKGLLDQLFLSGVNHIFFHGTAYSPDDAPWPGWLFYASTEMNPRNPIWHDAPALNSYIERVQSVLQDGIPDNDILLYWPIYDIWHSDKGLNINMTVHHRQWFEDFPVATLADKLWRNGWTFDFISDRQLAACRPDGINVKTAGGTRYRAIVVPATTHMPVATAEKLAALAKAGVKVIYDTALPTDVPGLNNIEARRQALQAALATAKPSPDVEAALRTTRSQPEPMTASHGLEFVRRSNATGRWYFITNRTTKAVDDYVELGVTAPGVLILDPLTGRSGAATLRRQGARPAVRLQLEPGASLILRTLDRYASGPRWQYLAPAGEPLQITTPRSVTFLAGGPELPAPYEARQLKPWSDQGPAYESFGGTAVYKTTLTVPAPGNYILDLGQVSQSARVRLNGKDLGTVWCAPFRLRAEALQLKNELEIEVTSTAANRIRDLDRRKVNWKNFYDINFVNMDYKPFDAANWPITPAGLQGPVQLTRLSAPATPARRAK